MPFATATASGGARPAVIVASQIVVAEDVGAPTPALDVSIPPGLVGSSPSNNCDPRDGWRVKGTPKSAVYTYRNYSGFIDAACAQSAGGVEAITVKQKAGSPSR